MKKIITLTIALMSVGIFLTGCGNADIETVKNGVLNSFPDAKIGPVFEAAFTDTNWQAVEKAGKHYVVFTGKISQATHDRLAAPWLSSKNRMDFLIDQLAKEEIYQMSLKVRNKYMEQEKPLKEKEHKLDVESRKISEEKRKLGYGNKSKLKALEKRTNEIYREKLAIIPKKRAIDNKCSEEINAMIKSFGVKLVKKDFWPAGSPVEIEFVVYPDQRLEVKNMKNDSWSKMRLTMEAVLQAIYQ